MYNQEREQVVLTMDQNPPPAASPGGLSVKPPRSPDLVAGSPAVPQMAGRQQATAQPRPALTRLPYSKPKSRFVELNHPLPCARASPISDRDTHDSEDEDDDEVADQAIEDEYPGTHRRRRRCRVRWRIALEWSAFVLLTALLAAALSAPRLEGHRIWGIPLWKWAVMLLVVLCGRLVSGWLISAIAFLIERRFLLEEKVLYFVYGLRRSVQNCIWLGLVLLAWTLVVNPAMDEHSHHRPRLRFMSRVLIAVLVGAAIWLVKIFLVKLLASSFHVATFFERMKESVFHHYILEALSGPPLGEEDRHLAGSDDDDGDLPPRPSSKRNKAGERTLPLEYSKSMPARLGASERRGLDMERLRRLSRTRATACGVRRLVGHVMKRGLSSSISRGAEELARGGGESEITTEWEARCAAERVFKNVARPGHKYIEEEDLMRFLRKSEVHTIFPLFEGALETGKIKKSAFRNWVVRAYLERKSLAHSLNDTKTAVQQLHKMASAVVCIVIIVVSLLVMGVATMKVFVVVTSQLLLVGFMFQNTGKTVFESIIFVFVMHPFDVGDRCVIDGVQMIVEEMNILTTVFLRYDNEMIYYPNSVLITKPISNFYRSPHMGEMIEFAIDVATPLDTITAMKKSIQAYIESKPKHWNEKHSVVVREIENVNRMKMALNVLHTMNHQNFPEKNNRRSELLLELKRIFESLNIKYHLLPQEVHLTQFVMANGRVPMAVEVEGR